MFPGILGQHRAAGDLQEPADELIGSLHLILPLQGPGFYRGERCHHGQQRPAHQRAAEHLDFLDPEFALGQIADHRGGAKGFG